MASCSSSSPNENTARRSSCRSRSPRQKPDIEGDPILFLETAKSEETTGKFLGENKRLLKRHGTQVVNLTESAKVLDETIDLLLTKKVSKCVIVDSKNKIGKRAEQREVLFSNMLIP